MSNHETPPEGIRPEQTGDKAGSAGMNCSPSSTPRTDALEVPILDTRANAIMAFQTVLEHAKKMERLYETERKDKAFMLKTLKRVIGEREALICSCPEKFTTMLRGENCDAPSCPKCGKMRTQFPENVPSVAQSRDQQS